MSAWSSATPNVKLLDATPSKGAGHGVYAVLSFRQARGETFEVPVCAYTHHPADGSPAYVVIDVDASDTVRVKVTVNDGTVHDGIVGDEEGCKCLHKYDETVPHALTCPERASV